jgi:DNA-binding SARP family transcriptional activator/tetratricopeptide (TPR) repeat protein
LEFRLLGNLEVSKEEAPVVITARRQEILLALLLLDAGHVVTMGRIVDALWAENPPKTARVQVQITVSALRQLLGDELIETRPPGYVIRIPAGAIDLEQFEEMVSSGTDEVAAGRPLEAAGRLRSALGLWRGQALEGLDSEVIEAAATSLNERRVSVLQDCIEIELQLGRHASLIGELTGLVADHPLNERFRTQLMLALYRSGRQAEALDTFRAGQEILREELGIAPSRAMSDLERAILSHDPDIAAPSQIRHRDTREPAHAFPVPRQLPRTIVDFIGRDSILSWMTKVLTGEDSDGWTPHVPVVVLSGRGGTGKTALAVRAAHLLRDRFPDGQLFMQLRPDTEHSVAGLLDYALRSAGIHPDLIPGDLEGRAAMYRSWLAERRVLIVIDGAIDSGQVTHFLPGTPSSAAIVTTAKRFLTLEGAHLVEIGPLDSESAFRLLTAVIGVDRARADEEAAHQLIALCEGLPLALRVAAAKLAARKNWPLSHLVRKLLDESGRLDELDLGGASVRATFAVAYAGLEIRAKELFRRLSVITGDFATWACGPLTGEDIDEAEELLHTLVQSHLVETEVSEDGTVGFRLHDLARIYAQERLAQEESADDRFAAVHRLLRCWLFLATVAHRRVYGGDFAVLHGDAEHWPLPGETVDILMTDPVRWFIREHSSLVRAIHLASQLDLDELCWDLAVTTATLFESGGYSSDWHESHASALHATRHAHNRRGEAALLYSFGTLKLGANMSEAGEHFQHSYEIFSEINDHHGCALALVGLAFVDRANGNYETAQLYHERALAGFRTAGDRAGEAHVLKTMAQICSNLRDYEQAEGFLDESLAICQELDTSRLTAQVQHALAELHLRRGRLRLAIEAFDSVLVLTRRNSDLVGQAYALEGLGNARRMLRDVDGADSALAAALELTESIDDRFVRLRVLLALAELDLAEGRPASAISRINEANVFLRELGSASVMQARVLELLGRLHAREGRASIARHAWASASELIGDADPVLTDQLAAQLARLDSESAGEQTAGPRK